MPKQKSQAFQNVHKAISLEHEGLHEDAFKTYLESLQMLSNILVNQYASEGSQPMLDANKTEAKQMLSIVINCAEMASKMLSSNDSKLGGSNTDSFNKETITSIFKSRYSVDANFQENPMTGLKLQENITAFNERLSPRPLPGVSHDSSSHNEQSNISKPVRESICDKIARENEVLCKKFQKRIETAKDNRIRSNLELELQRRLAENLVIAKSKFTAMQKQQQEGRKKVFETTLKNLSKIGPCANELEQEKRDLYVKTLEYEANSRQSLAAKFCYIKSTSTSTIVEKIIELMLNLKGHPLTRWLNFVQVQTKEKLQIIINQYSCFQEWLPENYPVCQENEATMSLPHSIDSSKRQGILEIQESLDKIAQEIQDQIDCLQQIFCHIYRNELPLDAEVFCYRTIEFFMLVPIWQSFLTVCRFANINRERRLAFTMSTCKNNLEDFKIPPTVPRNDQLFGMIVQRLRLISKFYSLGSKLDDFVYITKAICETTVDGNTDENKKFGANDLIPVLSYLLVHSKNSQLLSECKALELLVNPKYMLGEEGYALTSFQTALNYLETKKWTEKDSDVNSCDESSDIQHQNEKCDDSDNRNDEESNDSQKNSSQAVDSK